MKKIALLLTAIAFGIIVFPSSANTTTTTVADNADTGWQGYMARG
ncbi:MAG TPA: hypothetical protein VFV52_16520 [Bacilli bacterium]|nr:hypothetical protein [Bacilli bacterium]